MPKQDYDIIGSFTASNMLTTAEREALVLKLYKVLKNEGCIGVDIELESALKEVISKTDYEHIETTLEEL